MWLVGGVVFVLLKHRLPGVTAYANLTVDNPVFEKEFKVHASNESEARALLTPAVAEGLAHAAPAGGQARLSGVQGPAGLSGRGLRAQVVRAGGPCRPCRGSRLSQPDREDELRLPRIFERCAGICPRDCRTNGTGPGARSGTRSACARRTPTTDSSSTTTMRRAISSSCRCCGHSSRTRRRPQGR